MKEHSKGARKALQLASRLKQQDTPEEVLDLISDILCEILHEVTAIGPSNGFIETKAYLIRRLDVLLDVHRECETNCATCEQAV